MGGSSRLVPNLGPVQHLIELGGAADEDDRGTGPCKGNNRANEIGSLEALLPLAALHEDRLPVRAEVPRRKRAGVDVVERTCHDGGQDN